MKLIPFYYTYDKIVLFEMMYMKQYIITIITAMLISSGIGSISLGFSNDSNAWIITGVGSLIFGLVIVVVKTRILDE
jgi:general stress protein CsbA